MAGLKKPELSPRFDLDDIRKLRDYNGERYWQMTKEERAEEYRQAREWVHAEMARIRAQKASAQA